MCLQTPRLDFDTSVSTSLPGLSTRLDQPLLSRGIMRDAAAFVSFSSFGRALAGCRSWRCRFAVALATTAGLGLVAQLVRARA